MVKRLLNRNRNIILFNSLIHRELKKILEWVKMNSEWLLVFDSIVNLRSDNLCNRVKMFTTQCERRKSIAFIFEIWAQVIFGVLKMKLCSKCVGSKDEAVRCLWKGITIDVRSFFFSMGSLWKWEMSIVGKKTIKSQARKFHVNRKWIVKLNWEANFSLRFDSKTRSLKW